MSILRYLNDKLAGKNMGLMGLMIREEEGLVISTWEL